MKRHLSHFGVFIIVMTTLLGCLFSSDQHFTAIPPGFWKGILYLGDPNIEGAVGFNDIESDNKLPFIFEVNYPTPDSFTVTIINAEERILLDQVDFGHNRSTGRDSVIFRFDEYGSYIMAYFEEDILEGHWYDPSRGDNYRLPFIAKNGVNERFNKESLRQSTDITGQWDCTFGIDHDDESWKAIGVFKQEENIVHGTFKTETGDYRFLDGSVNTDKLWLSCFDGAHAFLFKAKIQEDSMVGFFKSGKHYQTLWTAKKSDRLTLKDPFEITGFEPSQNLDFTLMAPTGDSMSFSQLIRQGQPTILQIMGTWCPNCKDESLFLKEAFKKYGQQFNFIAIAFERTANPAQAYASISQYKNALDLPYPVYLGGKASKKAASEFFNQLSGISSFPTLLFLDKNSQIVKIHTGFYGPATVEYTQFLETFDGIVQNVLKQEG